MSAKAIPYDSLSDGTMLYRSACRMCHGGCGALVHVKNGTVVKVTGDPSSPLSKGRMCVKGLSSVEHLYNPFRLKYPLKRAGKRGGGKWQRISWDDALDTIAERIETFRDESGIESVAIGQGTGRHHVTHTIRFADALGTPNWCEPGGAQCFIPRISAGVMAYGDFPIVDYYGDVNPACLLVWGHNPLVSGPDGETQFLVRDCLAKGAKMIVIDPRRIETAGKADMWLQIRPGTDDALALAFINVLISEQLYDRPFVEQWTVGFADLAERVRDNTPEWAESVTSVQASLIRNAARMFAAARPAAVEWGVGLEHSPNCMQTVRAVSLLPALTGNVDVPGGWIFGNHALLRTPSRPVPEAKRELRLGADRFKALAGPMAVLPEAHGPSVFRAMRTEKPYRVRAFLIFGNNALVSYANSRQVYDSLMKLDFLSVMDIYMTPTAELADIVLPAATWLEVDALVGMPLIAEPFALV
jgi:thiosulfate reductase / polysulfide reductase chain A